jgi:hypothetical protein
MPAPQSSVMQELAKAQFRTFMIKLPLDWRQPQGEAGKQYVQAFKPSELVAVPPVGRLFIPASVNKYHCDTVTEISGKFERFIDGICSAICQAWATWQAAASLSGVTIFGPIAALGQLVGPPWLPIIMGAAPKSTPMELRYSMAIAMTLSNAWLQYTATVKVPSMAWYPAFAAFPGPVTPPMPNIPTPVISLTQVTVPVSKVVLKGQMIGNLGDPMALHHVQLFDSIADAFEKVFQIWQTSTQVTNVMGFGPVPTFAPPVVPVGPVVGGVGSMLPGGLV